MSEVQVQNAMEIFTLAEAAQFIGYSKDTVMKYSKMGLLHPMKTKTKGHNSYTFYRYDLERFYEKECQKKRDEKEKKKRELETENEIAHESHMSYWIKTLETYYELCRKSPECISSLPKLMTDYEHKMYVRKCKEYRSLKSNVKPVIVGSVEVDPALMQIDDKLWRRYQQHMFRIEYGQARDASFYIGGVLFYAGMKDLYVNRRMELVRKGVNVSRAEYVFLNGAKIEIRKLARMFGVSPQVIIDDYDKMCAYYGGG